MPKRQVTRSKWRSGMGAARRPRLGIRCCGYPGPRSFPRPPATSRGRDRWRRLGLADRQRRRGRAKARRCHCEIEDVHAGSESRAIHDKFGGATRLIGELCVPFSPERSGGDPFLADGFARIARSKRVPGHGSTLNGASRFKELYVNWVSVNEFLAVKSKVIV